MQGLYTLIIWLYGRLLRLLALLGHRQAAHWVQGRRQWREKVQNLPANRRIVWFHTASAGEFEQGRPIMELHRQHNPNDFILLTFFSPSGYLMRHDYAGADLVCYLPEDLPAEVAAWNQLVNPSLAVFVKYEFWPHHFAALRQNKVPLLLVSAPFRPSQPFFRWPTRRFWGKMLACVHHFYVQDAASARLLAGLGYHNSTVCGDTRTDRVMALAQQAFVDPVLEAFARNQAVLVAGSTWPADERLLADWLQQHSNARLLLASHTVNSARTAELLERFGPGAIAYTAATPADAAQSRVLILNTMGMLGKVYRYGRAAYIGGGFGKGIHNTLEAAIYGIPVFFGPKNEKFLEAQALKAEGLGFEITDAHGLNATWAALAEPGKSEQIRTKAASWFNAQAGASKRIANDINRLLAS